MATEKRLLFKFYSSYFEIAQELNDKDRLAFYDALMKKQFTGIDTDLKGMANFAYISQKHSIDKQVEGWEFKMKATLNQDIINPIKGGVLGGALGGVVQEEVKEKEKEEVKEKEKEENDIPPTAFSMYRSLLDLGAEKQLINDWLKVRKTKKAADTETALNGFVNEVEKSGRSINEILKICIENSWKGFKVSWLENLKNNTNGTTKTNGNGKVSGTQNLIDGLEYFEFT